VISNLMDNASPKFGRDVKLTGNALWFDVTCASGGISIRRRRVGLLIALVAAPANRARTDTAVRAAVRRRNVVGGTRRRRAGNTPQRKGSIRRHLTELSPIRTVGTRQGSLWKGRA
jgi:hypothetical protein